MSTENQENCNSCNNHSHADMVLKQLKGHLDKQQLCDVVLISGIDGKRLPAHRLVLSANSNFFSAMFTNPMREANDSEVTLGEVNNDVLKILVNYCYTGNLEVHDDNVELLITTANRWQMDSAVTTCGNFMARKMDLSNCLGISFIAEQHNCTALMELTVNYISQYFANVSQSQEFLQLSADQLGKLLSSDDLQVPSEEEVFRSLMSWVQHDELARKQHIAKLMAKVRLPLMTPSFIEDHVESVCSANECQNLLVEAYKCHAMPERLLSLARRKITASSDCLLAIGKMQQELVIESYCPTKKQWTLVKKLKLKRDYYGAALIENKLILVGGGNIADTVKTTLSLDLKSMTWTQLQPISSARVNVGVAVLKGLLYVVGGWYGSSLNTVERWNPETGVWNSVAPMPTARHEVGVAVLNDCLYVIGGHDGRTYSRCVERYDPCTNEWSRLSPMNEARKNFGVTEVNGLLYAIGGSYGGSLNSVECYNPTIDEWIKVCSLTVSRHRHGCALFANRIVVAGGTDSKGDITTVEEYDPVHDVWNKLASLNTPMHSTSLFVIHNDVIKPTENP